MGDQLTLRGTLEGHNGWVTAISTTAEDPNLVLSASRDKTIIVWQLTRSDQTYGFAVRSLEGHSHCAFNLQFRKEYYYALCIASWLLCDSHVGDALYVA